MSSNVTGQCVAHCHSLLAPPLRGLVPGRRDVGWNPSSLTVLWDVRAWALPGAQIPKTKLGQSPRSCRGLLLCSLRTSDGGHAKLGLRSQRAGLGLPGLCFRSHFRCWVLGFRLSGQGLTTPVRGWCLCEVVTLPSVRSEVVDLSSSMHA